MTIIWHSYPKEKPQAECGTPFRIILSNGIEETSEWRGEEGFFEWQYYDDSDVVAWAEMEEADT